MAKTIKLSKYFEIHNPTYAFLKVIPQKSIRNYNSSNIAKAITHTFRGIHRRFTIEKKKAYEEAKPWRTVHFEAFYKIAYIVDIRKNNAEFYFMVPASFMTILIEKIREIWPTAGLEEVKGIEPFTDSAIAYQMTYKKEDAFSLQTDKKSNEPLNSILNVMEIMKEDDRITIVYNFMPKAQYGWKRRYDSTLEKFKQKKPMDREKLSIKYMALTTFQAIISLLDSVVELFIDFTGGPSENAKPVSIAETIALALEYNSELSAATKKKRDLRILNNQTAVISQSQDETRKENNALAVCQAYRVLDEDTGAGNEFIYKRAKKIPDLYKFQFEGYDFNVMSTDECQNFIQIPGRTLLKQFNISHIQTTEMGVPQKLTEGYISLGTVKHKDTHQTAYFEDEYNIGNLPLLLTGAQGSGKSTYIANYFRYIHRRKEGALLLDYIKGCELADAVCAVIPKDDLIILDLSKEEDVQGLGFNEIKITEDMSVYEKLKLANLQAQQTMALIDSINPTSPLSSQMRRYVAAASNVVFAGGHTSIRDVVNCLEYHEKRHRYISNLSDDLKQHLEDEISDLYSMDEIDNKTKAVCGTKVSKVDHIMDRVNLLKEDFKLKYMFNKGTENNIDLVELMEQGKIVIIKMPQNEFPTRMIKNVLITYWISKKWLSDQIRGSMHSEPKRTHTVIDEVFQAPTSMDMLEYILPQTRKFGSRMVFSTQYMKQIDPIEEALSASGCSYMFLKGTREEDFKKFEHLLEGFEYEDVRDMNNDSAARYSLNLIYYSGGYASFISRLPGPVK